MDTWLPYLIDTYQWVGAVVGAITYLGSEEPLKQRIVTTALSAIAWPWVVWRHFQSRTPGP